MTEKVLSTFPYLTDYTFQCNLILFFFIFNGLEICNLETDNHMYISCKIEVFSEITL
jgi:hypothetical protein